MKILGPLYAIPIAIMLVRRLIEMGFLKIFNTIKVKYPNFSQRFEKKKKASKPRRPRRSSIYISGDRKPQVRKTKNGVYVYYE